MTNTWLVFFGILFIIIGLALLIWAIVLMATSKTIPWYTWLLLALGIIFFIIGAFMLYWGFTSVPAVIAAPVQQVVTSVCPKPVCPQPAPVVVQPKPIEFTVPLKFMYTPEPMQLQPQAVQQPQQIYTVQAAPQVVQQPQQVYTVQPAQVVQAPQVVQQQPMYAVAQRPI